MNKKENRGTMLLLKYLSGTVVLIAFISLGIKYSSSSKTEELPESPKEEVVLEEKIKKEETTDPKDEIGKENTAVKPTSSKRKIVKPVEKQEETEELIAETVIAEDTLQVRAKSVVNSSHHAQSILRTRCPSLSSKPNYFSDKTERKPEVILKDAEVFTRNGDYTYVVDGMRVSEETFRSLDQNDIESIDIYKHSDFTRAMHSSQENQSRITLRTR